MTSASAPPADPILRLHGISKNFGAVSALTDIALDVHAGEVVALVGDNGAGKSTLVKILAGVHQPSAGTIEYLGQPVTLDSPARGARHGHSHRVPGPGAVRKSRCGRQSVPRS